MMEDFGYCNVCHSVSKFICQRCSDSYCSVKCQVEDWPTHRMFCVPMPKLVDRSFKHIKHVSSVHHELELPKQISKVANKDPGVVSRRNSMETEKCRHRMPTTTHYMEVPRQPKVSENFEIAKVQSATAGEEPLALISSLISLGVTTFTGQLGVVITESLFSVVVDFPDIISKKYDGLLQDFNKEAAEFEHGKLDVGMMIAVKGPKSKFVRAIVLALDIEVGACIIYLCDFGTFEVLMKLPDNILVCPPKFVNFPGKAILVELVAGVHVDREKFLSEFFNSENILSFDIKKKRNGLYAGQVNLNGKDAGQVCVFETTPSLSLCNISQWSIQIPSDTVVKVIRISTESDIRAWIVPSDKNGVYDALLHKVGQKLDACKVVPDKNSMVVHVQGQRGGRLLVTKHLSQDMVEVFDVDNGRRYKCEWNQLKVGNDFVRNLPVHAMYVKVVDATDATKFDKQEIQEYLQSIEFRKMEFIFTYSGYAAFGCKLITGNETLGQMIVKNFAEKQAAVDEMTRKQKEREADELKQRKQKAEIERKKAPEEERLKKVQEAELERKQEEERQQKAKKEEMERQKAAAKAESLKSANSHSPAKVSLMERLQKLKVKQEKHPKIFLSDLNPIPLEVGKTLKFIITDPGTEGMVGVCEDSPANNKFLQQILIQSEEYISTVNVRDLVGYRPDPEEICMACYEDGSWYRAQCIGSTESSFLMILIDFGTVCNVNVSKIMPLPEEFKEPPPRTHLVSIEATKVNKLELFSKHRCTVESFHDDMYTLVLA